MRLALLAVVPSFMATFIAMLVLGSYSKQQLTQLLLEQGRLEAALFATRMQEPVAATDHSRLRQLVEAAIKHQPLQGITVVSATGEVLAQARRADASEDILEVQSPLLDEQGVNQGQVALQYSKEMVELICDKQDQLIVALLAGWLIMIGGLSWWVARKVSKPIDVLADAMDQLGHGVLAQVEVNDEAEIGRLQRGFNSTAQSLLERRQNLQARIDAATTQLMYQNAQLQALSESKTRLLAMASHDLRQPLHALTLFIDALKDGEGDPLRQEHVKRMQECVEALDRLFSELLDLTRLDSGVVQPQWSVQHLDTLFDEVSRNFRPIAETQGLRLIVRKTDLHVRCDYGMLARSLNNLVSNALHHTLHGGVLLGARRAAGKVRIDIWDTGIGIAAEHQQRVFEDFYQVPMSARPGTASECGGRVSRGMGLGLATVRRLCELMSVPIQLRSVRGRGTVISLWLEDASQSARQDPCLTVDTAFPLPVNGLRILIVDDEPVILESLSMVLNNWGMMVEVASSVAEALELAAAWQDPVDIVLTDLLLSDGDGIDVLRGIYAIGNVRERPPAGLIVTGETKPERLHAVAQAGVPVLHKPVSPRVLREAIVASLLHQGSNLVSEACGERRKHRLHRHCTWASGFIERIAYIQLAVRPIPPADATTYIEANVPAHRPALCGDDPHGEGKYPAQARPGSRTAGAADLRRGNR
jgi:signal transduction histidine kinase/FixJ family two-component response regulator